MSGDLSFIWGQNEDCSPGDSTSDSSEKLLQRRGGMASVCDFGEGGLHAVEHIFSQKDSTSLVKLR